MQSDFPAAIRAAAIAWHIRLRDGGIEDWDHFADWLSHDPAHSLAYDQVSAHDAGIDQALLNWSREKAEANDNQPIARARPRHRSWLVGGLAAATAAAAALLVTPASTPAHDYYQVSTAPREHRLVALPGSYSIALNGSTRIGLDRRDPRFASLIAGEASFAIVHNRQSPFELEVGDSRVRDVGTKFNVVRTPTGHTIEVSEGAVLYNPSGERIALVAGQTLTRNLRERRVRLASRAISEIGGWQRGRLSYTTSTLAGVAADLSRNIGTPIVVQPEIAARSFSGTIEIDRNENRLFSRLAPLLDVKARRGRDGWTLEPAPHPPA